MRLKINRIAIISTLCCCFLMGTAQGACVGDDNTLAEPVLMSEAEAESDGFSPLSAGAEVIVKKNAAAARCRLCCQWQSGVCGHSLIFSLRREPEPLPGEEAVTLAKEYMGYSYVWGGNSPETGFDCSGLVSYVFQTLGYETNRTAAEIFKNGLSVEKSELMPGDAVFFGPSASGINHVGMYIGDGEFIHSSSAAGEVTISELSENYYTRNYVGAKRIAD